MTIAPRRTALSGMSPGQRQKMLAEARRKRDAQRDEGLHDGLRRSLLQATAQNMAMLYAERMMKLQVDQTGKWPVRLGDIRHGGNIFHIIGAVRESIRWAEDKGYTVSETQHEVVNGFMHRKYEETLDLIVEHFTDCDGSIAAYRLARWGDPVAPGRHNTADSSTFATTADEDEW